MPDVTEAVFIALLLINLLPAALCLLLGALRWATTFLLLGALASIAIAAIAAAVATAANALAPALAPSAAPLLTALGLEFLIAAQVNRARRPAPEQDAPNHAAASRAGDAGHDNWIVRFHDAIHGATRR